MNDTMIVRRAVADDAEALQAFVSVLFTEGLDTIFEKKKIPSVEDERNFIEGMNAQENCFVLIALAGAKVIGMLDFKAHKNPQMDHSGVFGMSVAREHRGQGIGRQILEALFRELETQKKIRRVELQVFSHNSNAIRLYESMGFVHEGCMREAVRQGDRYSDMLFMAKITERETSDR